MYSRMSSESPAFWPQLIEKAWAKTFGNYQNVNAGGFSTQSMRAFTGAPAYYHDHEGWYISTFDLFTYIFNGQAIGFHHVARTYKSEDGQGDTKINDCGVTHSHAFPVLKALQLYENGGDSGTVVANLLMMKDPRGSLALSNYKGDWNTNDTVSWTQPLRQYVIDNYAFDPLDWSFKKETGVFFVPHDQYKVCFQATDEIQDRSSDGYSNDWYDFDDDAMWGTEHQLAVSVPEKSGILYFQIESYYYG